MADTNDYVDHLTKKDGTEVDLHDTGARDDITELKNNLAQLENQGFYIDEDGYLCQNTKEDE